MILTYRGHRTRVQEVGLTISVDALRTQAQVIWGYKETWRINGLMTSQVQSPTLSSADIRSRINVLEMAYSVDGGDAKLLYPDGVTVARALFSAGSLGGVKVIQPPCYPDPKGVELLTKRAYTIVLEAVYPVPGSGAALESFQETFTPEKSGGKFVMVETLMGPAVKQRTRNKQKYRAVQSGSAVGKFQYPTIPPPLFPNDLVNGYNPPVYGQPKRVLNSWIDWPVSWNYEFESDRPLISAPHIWNTSSPAVPIPYTYH